MRHYTFQIHDSGSKTPIKVVATHFIRHFDKIRFFDGYSMVAEHIIGETISRLIIPPDYTAGVFAYQGG